MKNGSLRVSWATSTGLGSSTVDDSREIRDKLNWACLSEERRVCSAGCLFKRDLRFVSIIIKIELEIR